MDGYFFETEQMTVGYDGVPLIRNIEIQLEKGEILTLIGPNGAGKSTILKSISCQLELLGGTVYIERQPIGDLSDNERARQISAVLTNRINPELMTCEDVVSMGRYPYTGTLGFLTDSDREEVREIMIRTNTMELRDRDFTAISDGQRQRVLLARALCQKPKILILDEPTSYLDIRYKLEFMSVLQQMARKNEMSVIMSLHELDLAERISDRVMCVKHGLIDRIGLPGEIFKDAYIRELFEVSEELYSWLRGESTF